MRFLSSSFPLNPKSIYKPIVYKIINYLHISISYGVWGSFNLCVVAREELLQKYPDRKLMLVDQLVASSGYGMLTDMTANLRDQGSLIEEVRT
jgi:fatty acid-binding protein DegV